MIHRLLSLKKTKRISNATTSNKKPTVAILRYFRSEKDSKDQTKSDLGQGPIWLDRLSDEPNLWLKATGLDAERDFIKAIPLYLKDIRYCLDEGLVVRAALSCSCAANCMEIIGQAEEARRLYAKAASIYVDKAYEMLECSIREALWSLQQAYENYTMALDETNAKKVYDSYLSIVSKISPFDSLDEKMEVMDFKGASTNKDKLKYSDIKMSPLNEEIRSALKEVFY